MKQVKITFTVDIMLFIVFLMLKLDGIIDWKWIWIFSPFWIAWIIKCCIAFVSMVVGYVTKSKHKPYVSSSPKLVWDQKTNTMYGPFDGKE